MVIGPQVHMHSIKEAANPGYSPKPSYEFYEQFYIPCNNHSIHTATLNSWGKYVKVIMHPFSSPTPTFFFKYQPHLSTSDALLWCYFGLNHQFISFLISQLMQAEHWGRACQLPKWCLRETLFILLVVSLPVILVCSNYHSGMSLGTTFWEKNKNHPLPLP